MSTPRSPNRDMLIRAAESLRPLLAEVVFVGGCVAELLVTDRAAPRIRETDDVDAIVQVATYSEYRTLGARLEELGFAHDMSPNAPACRWLTPADELGRIRVDIMPTVGSRIGPTNPWYEVGMSTSESFSLTRDLTIRNTRLLPHFSRRNGQRSRVAGAPTS